MVASVCRNLKISYYSIQRHYEMSDINYRAWNTLCFGLFALSFYQS